jgi:hypothetical protein
MLTKMQGVLLAQWDDLWTMEFDDLQKHVLLRALRHKKGTYQEKISNDFASYVYVDKYNAIRRVVERQYKKTWPSKHCLRIATPLRTPSSHQWHSQMRITVQG